PSYYIEFLHRSAGLQEPGIRNASVASLLHNTARLGGVELGVAERPAALTLQLLLAALVGWWSIGTVRGGMLVRSGSIEERVIGSAFATLSVVMLVISPSLWPHHLVFAILPTLAILLTVRTVPDATLLGIAYFVMFLMPVHEVYPFAYLRLGG